MKLGKFVKLCTDQLELLAQLIAQYLTCCQIVGAEMRCVGIVGGGSYYGQTSFVVNEFYVFIDGDLVRVDRYLADDPTVMLPPDLEIEYRDPEECCCEAGSGSGMTSGVGMSLIDQL